MSGQNDEKDQSDYYPKLSKAVQYWEFKRNRRQGPWEWYYYIQAEGNEMDYHITDAGVSVDFKDGSCIHLNACPRTLFPDAAWELSDDQLVHLISLPVEGKKYDADQMYETYQEYLEAKARGETE